MFVNFQVFVMTFLFNSIVITEIASYYFNYFAFIEMQRLLLWPNIYSSLENTPYTFHQNIFYNSIFSLLEPLDFTVIQVFSLLISFSADLYLVILLTEVMMFSIIIVELSTFPFNFVNFASSILGHCYYVHIYVYNWYFF